VCLYQFLDAALLHLIKQIYSTKHTITITGFHGNPQ